MGQMQQGPGKKVPPSYPFGMQRCFDCIIPKRSYQTRFGQGHNRGGGNTVTEQIDVNAMWIFLRTVLL